MPALPLRHGQGFGEEAIVKLVLDTNIVLDLFVFRDGAVRELHAAIESRRVEWLATDAMRDELACVLAYDNIAARMTLAQVAADHVLAAFDSHATVVESAPRSTIACRDGDDQKFVDLAAAHGATLLSKDAQVLALRRKLAVSRAFSPPQPQ
jgi:putative PIN family toxin of toxin-antitoxin system